MHQIINLQNLEQFRKWKAETISLAWSHTSLRENCWPTKRRGQLSEGLPLNAIGPHSGMDGTPFDFSRLGDFQRCWLFRAIPDSESCVNWFWPLIQVRWTWTTVGGVLGRILNNMCSSRGQWMQITSRKGGLTDQCSTDRFLRHAPLTGVEV